ncbi:TetR/AcrR family transcriptional regulator [Mesorhizobium sp. A556]
MLAKVEAVAADDVNPKERIFHAAMAVALRKGFGKVALSLVAREAGFSKGGLLHHFATKDNLIRSMLAFYADPTARHAQPVLPGEANAFVSGCDPFAVAVLIAAAENPLLLEVVRTQLASGTPDLTDRLETTPGHLRLVGDLVAKLSQRRRLT